MRALLRTLLSSYPHSHKHLEIFRGGLILHTFCRWVQTRCVQIICRPRLSLIDSLLVRCIAINVGHRLGNMIDTWVDMTSNSRQGGMDPNVGLQYWLFWMLVVCIALQKRYHGCLWAPPYVACWSMAACLAAFFQNRVGMNDNRVQLSTVFVDEII